MRKIDVSIVESSLEKLLIDINYNLPFDVKNALQLSVDNETNSTAREVLDVLVKNYDKAAEGEYPLCQDTGMAIVFLEIGQDVFFTGGSLKDAIYRGVENAYDKGYLRKSVVKDPLFRENTGNNLPPVIYTDIVSGDKLLIKVMVKGFGSENQSKQKMMLPSSSKNEIVDFIVDGIVSSGGKGCPPCIIGVGIGGTFDYAAYLSKKALFRPLDDVNSDSFYADLEKMILQKINDSKVGAMGVGGDTTCLGVKIMSYPTHIAGLPVAYTYSCHSTRHGELII